MLLWGVVLCCFLRIAISLCGHHITPAGMMNMRSVCCLFRSLRGVWMLPVCVSLRLASARCCKQAWHKGLLVCSENLCIAGHG